MTIPSGAQVPHLFVVIVLYKMRIPESVALQSLRAAMQANTSPLSLQILIFDNTPEVQTEPPPADLEYVGSSSNRGLSAAYNEGGRLALERGAAWLLTLDQDTTLPREFLSKLARILAEVADDGRVAGVVPCLCQGRRKLSPHYFSLGFLQRPFPVGFSGVAKESVHAFNSAATIRLEAFQQVGGYSEIFWLDFSDAYFFHQLHLHHFRIFVAGDIVVQHQLSLLDTSERMSNERFSNILEAGSAFYDMMPGPIAGIMFSFVLAKSYLAKLVLRRDAQHRRILAKMLKERLVHSKRYRLRHFLEQRATQTGLSVSKEV